MFKYLFKRGGFTLIKIIIAMSIFATLSGIITINLLHAQSKTSLDTSVASILADIKGQQTLAMSGSIQGGTSASEYGIYFGTTSYTIFSGSSYSANNSTNFVIPLKNNVNFSSVTFPSRVIIFQRASGEIANFNSAQNQITLSNQGGENKTITLNGIGVISSVQ